MMLKRVVEIMIIRHARLIMTCLSMMYRAKANPILYYGRLPEDWNVTTLNWELLLYWSKLSRLVVGGNCRQWELAAAAEREWWHLWQRSSWVTVQSVGCSLVPAAIICAGRLGCAAKVLFLPYFDLLLVLELDKSDPTAAEVLTFTDILIHMALTQCSVITVIQKISVRLGPKSCRAWKLNLFVKTWPRIFEVLPFWGWTNHSRP